MSGDAIAMMLVAIAILWGGLIAAIVYTNRIGARGQQSRRDL